MANTGIALNYLPGFTESGTDYIYMVVRDRAGFIWDTVGVAFETFAIDDWAVNYSIDMSENVTDSGIYIGPFPPGIDAGRYYVDIHKQEVGTRHQRDQLIDNREIDWDGAAIMDGDTILTRAISGVEVPADDVSLATLILSTVNKANTTDNAGFLTVYQTDGLTEHVQIPITTTGDADPIDGVG